LAETRLQKAFVKAAFYLARRLFPGLDNRQLVEGPFAAHAFGAIPEFSDLTHHRVTNIATSTDGAFILAYGRDPVTKEYLAVLIQRHEKTPDGSPRYGASGGYMGLGNIAKAIAGEQPAEGAVREWHEEMIDDRGNPVVPISTGRLRPLMPSVDYKAKWGYPVHNDAFSMELSEAELLRIKHHAARLAEDPAYRAGVLEKSKNEVDGIIVMPLAEAVKTLADLFTYRHEFAALEELHANLRAQNAKILPARFPVIDPS